MKKIPKIEVKRHIQFFFENVKEKTPEEIKKIKRLAASQNVLLKENRKKFCKRCLNPYQNPKIRIKKGVKTLTCEKCSYVAKWKLKN